jgi:hypothetical protein
MQYRITKRYVCKETTCGELVLKLKSSGGDINCVVSDFVDPVFPSDVGTVSEAWAWIQARHPSKKLYLVDEVDSMGNFI